MGEIHLTIIQQANVQDGFNTALHRSKETNESILFSVTKKVEVTAPLLFYSLGKQLFHGERFFWKDKNSDLALAGLGIAHFIQTDEKKKRFQAVESAWLDFLEHAVILNKHEVPGTGPLLFGGFSFDPESVKEQAWSPFSNGLFYLPQFMYTLYKGDAYLTTNIVCSPYDEEKLLQQIDEMEAQLLAQNKQEEINNSLHVKKQEEFSPALWKQSVRDVVHLLQQSDRIEKVVLARKMKLIASENIESDAVLQRLWDEQHDSFIFSLEAMNSCFVGATPERLVNKLDKKVLSTCLAGSIRRSDDVEEDTRLGQELLADKKNLYEHLLVVSMIKEVMKKYCDEINIPSEPILMKIRDIQHLYTPVSGTINPQYSLLRLVEDLHPTPALGGTPKEEAMAVIRKTEKMDRGYYAAPIGWIDYRGNGEFAVAIRSGLIVKNEALIYAGCGIVEDSQPEEEYKETKIKFRPMLRSLGGQGA